MFFRKKDITIEHVKDLLLPRINIMNPKIVANESNRFQVNVFTKGRSIEIKLNSFHRNSVTVDVIDPFGIVRIPRKTFKKMDDFKLYMLTDFTRLLNEYSR